jgi:hypothetical protein
LRQGSEERQRRKGAWEQGGNPALATPQRRRTKAAAPGRPGAPKGEFAEIWRNHSQVQTADRWRFRAFTWESVCSREAYVLN